MHRPGVGLPPRSEARRAWLPQQSRFCPVLEDGNRLGVLVYPPLALDEVLQVRHLDGGAFRFTLHRSERVVFILVAAAGETGAAVEVLQFDPGLGLAESSIPAFLEAATMNLGGDPPGAIGLRGAHDFVTPDGWDTVYGGVVNQLERPIVPSIVRRERTDEAVVPTVFRYALAPGEAISASGYAPVGQVFFVPRGQAELRRASDAERARFVEELESYWGRKHEHRQYTAYGGVFDRQYRAESRAFDDSRGSPRAG